MPASANAALLPADLEAIEASQGLIWARHRPQAIDLLLLDAGSLRDAKQTTPPNQRSKGASRG